MSIFNRSTSTREKALWILLAVLVVIMGADQFLRSHYLPQRRGLKSEIFRAENLAAQHALLIRDSDRIRKDYARLSEHQIPETRPPGNPAQLILEIESMARSGIVLASLDPRTLATEDGSGMILDLEFTGKLRQSLTFLRTIASTFEGQVQNLTIFTGEDPKKPLHYHATLYFSEGIL